MESFNDYMADDIQVVDEDALSEAMFDFIAGLGDEILDTLTEEQLGEYVEIIEAVAADEDALEEEDVDEGMPARKVRRDIQQKKAASREHRKHKAKRKIEGKRKRKTADFKRFKKRAKRLGKRGLTSTGKRQRQYINKG
jgi:hypothetical protein